MPVITNIICDDAYKFRAYYIFNKFQTKSSRDEWDMFGVFIVNWWTNCDSELKEYMRDFISSLSLGDNGQEKRMAFLNKTLTDDKELGNQAAKILFEFLPY